MYICIYVCLFCVFFVLSSNALTITTIHYDNDSHHNTNSNNTINSNSTWEVVVLRD